MAISLVSSNHGSMVNWDHVSVPAPPTITAGNLLIAIEAVMSGVPSGPVFASDWTLAGTAIGGGTQNQMAVAWKVASASEPANYAFQYLSSNAMIMVVILQYTGVTKIEVNPSYYSSGATNVTSFPAPSVTAVGANDMWVIAVSGSLGTGCSTPSGFAFRDGVTPGPNLSVFDRLLTTSGATGTATATTGSAQVGTAMSLLLTDAPQPVRVTDFAAEALIARGSVPIRMTQIASEILVAKPPMVFRMTQVAAEVIVRRGAIPIAAAFAGSSTMTANVGLVHMYSRSAVFAGTSSLTASPSIVHMTPLGSVSFVGGSQLVAALQTRKSGEIGFVPLNRAAFGTAPPPPPPPGPQSMIFGSNLSGGNTLANSTDGGWSSIQESSPFTGGVVQAIVWTAPPSPPAGPSLMILEPQPLTVTE